MCCEASWKREIVPDHKFDFLNVSEFRKTDLWTRLTYILRYIFLLKSIAVYGLDIFTAVTMLASGHWTNVIQAKCGDNCAVEVQFGIAKWVFVGCIIFSFLLLGYELYKAKKVIDSRDISYAFTNLMANDYYAFKSYDNHCLFSQISSSTKKKDDFAFWIFFTFKDWKRLLLADGPRQSINALTLYSFAAAYGFQTQNISAYWDNSPITAMLLFSIIATVAIFICSLVLLVAAAVLYVPLLCYIQGNLKEYVCHKVDKRITELVKKNHRHRAQRQAALEKKLASDALKGKKNDAYAGRVMQPTLPDVKLDDDDLSMEEAGWRSGKSSVEGHGLDGVSTLGYDYPGYPPRKSYNRPYGAASRYPDEYGSSTNLAAAAAPMGLSYPPPAASVMPPPLSTQSSYSNLPPRSAPPPSAPPSSYALAGPVFPPSRSQTSLSAWSNPPSTAPVPYSQPPASRSITPSPPQHYGYPPVTPADYPQPQRSYSREPVMSFPAPLPTSSSRPDLAVSQDPYRHQGQTVLSPSSISSHTVQSGYMDTRRGSASTLGVSRAAGGGAGWTDYGRDVMQRRRSDLGSSNQDDDDAVSGLAYDQLDSQEPAPRYSPVDHVQSSGYGKR